jgi:hypothetical protein
MAGNVMIRLSTQLQRNASVERPMVARFLYIAPDGLQCNAWILRLMAGGAMLGYVTLII